jgi:hypothetical protein
VGRRSVSASSEPAALPQAIVGAFSYADVVLIERFVAGTEVAVTVLDGEALPPVEIQPEGGRLRLRCPLHRRRDRVPRPRQARSRGPRRLRTGRDTAYTAVGARHLSRADMIVDAAGTPWLLEIDTCPGMTRTSLVPMAAAAADLDVRDLCERLVSNWRSARRCPTVGGVGERCLRRATARPHLSDPSRSRRADPPRRPVDDGIEPEVEEPRRARLRPQHTPDPDGPAPSVVVFDIGEVLIDESRVWAIWSGLLGRVTPDLRRGARGRHRPG